MRTALRYSDVYGDTVKMKHVKRLRKKAVCIKTGRKHCICTWYRETKNSAAKEYRNIRRLSGPFKRIYKKNCIFVEKGTVILKQIQMQPLCG